jgi:hypothetical protein
MTIIETLTDSSETRDNERNDFLIVGDATKKGKSYGTLEPFV